MNTRLEGNASNGGDARCPVVEDGGGDAMAEVVGTLSADNAATPITFGLVAGRLEPVVVVGGDREALDAAAAGAEDADDEDEELDVVVWGWLCPRDCPT